VNWVVAAGRARFRRHGLCSFSLFFFYPGVSLSLSGCPFFFVIVSMCLHFCPVK
jgi:hypothetical protein